MVYIEKAFRKKSGDKMIIYTTGNLLESSAEALVNTVNCEGYMGKGIAYQFKLQYPENNKDYVKACKNKTLRIGEIHSYREKEKIIINFPTKDKWREKSKMEYIDVGLDKLIHFIEDQNIKSIAIPPLGSGNGGLIWAEVKALIENKFASLPSNIQVYIYEPSQNYKAKPKEEPKLSMSALILLDIKEGLNKFDRLRLQKTAYFINIFSKDNYFKFKKHQYGPYDHSIAVISRKIKEFQEYHEMYKVEEVYKLVYQKIVSEKIEMQLNTLKPFIKQAIDYVNSIETNHELEAVATITYLIEQHKKLSQEEIIDYFKEWSEDKANRFTKEDILEGINQLEKSHVIRKVAESYSLS